MRKTEKSYISAVVNALDVLEQIQNNSDGLGITELSNRLNIPKNRVFRILATLETRYYVEPNNSKQSFRLGRNSLFLGQIFIDQNRLIRQAKPVLKALTSKCLETSYVSVLNDFHLVYIDVVESGHIVRVVPKVGRKLPIYCTAAGKVLASGINLERLREYFNLVKISKYTSNTISDPAALTEHLLDISKQGYAVDNEEFENDVNCVGAPIRDYTKQIIGAVSVSGPSMRISIERMNKELIPLVKKAADEISSRLGYL